MDLDVGVDVRVGRFFETRAECVGNAWTAVMVCVWTGAILSSF